MSPGDKKLSVLVVDDYPDAAAMTCEMIRALGHNCEAATDGVEGLARARALAPDLVVLDIGLPDISGYEIARQLRDTIARPMVIAALTGWGQVADLEQAAQAGFDHHIVKPASVGKLRRLVEITRDRLAVM